MRRLIRWLFDVPSSVTAFGRRLDEMEDAYNQLAQRIENVRGGLLTQARRITRLQAELQAELDDEDELDEDGDQIQKLISDRRKRALEQ